MRDLLARVTGDPAVMWGRAIVGFGRQHLRCDTGRELDRMVTGTGCLYLKRLAEVDLAVLQDIVTRSVAHARAAQG